MAEGEKRNETKKKGKRILWCYLSSACKPGQSSILTKVDYLTLYHEIPTFNNPKTEALVTSIFSFSHNVFYPSLYEFQFLVKFNLSYANAFDLD